MAAAEVSVAATEEKMARKLSYAEQKERAKALNRAGKAVDSAEAEVNRLEAEMADLESKIAAGDASTETLDQYQTIQQQPQEAMERWEEASLYLESLNEE